MTTEFFTGRQEQNLEAPFKGKNAVYASQRLDKCLIASPEFSHCTFANLSFKDSEINGGKFENCVFIACYFRRAQIRNVIFLGCKFIDCLFPSVSISDSIFRFPIFRGSFIEFDRIEHCLPRAPHERYLMTSNLESVAQLMGEGSQAHEFRLEATKAWEGHLWLAIIGKGSYYKEHFPHWSQRVKKLWQLAWSRLNGLIWGHGERGWVLTRNFLIIFLVVFPMLYWGFKHQVSLSTQGSPKGFDYMMISLGNILPGDWGPEIGKTTRGVQALRALESFIGVLFAGMLVSLLFKVVTRR